MALTSDEVNYLIYRYLRECGFEHSAYTFGHESFIYKSSLDASNLAAGALISYIQKGLQYNEIETHINNDGTETICNESFNVLRKHVCSNNLTNNPNKYRKRIYDPYEPIDNDFGALEIDQAILLNTNPNINNKDNNANNNNNTNNWNNLNPNPSMITQLSFIGGLGSVTVLATGHADGSINIFEVKDKIEETKSSSSINPKNKNINNKFYTLIKTINDNNNNNNNSNNNTESKENSTAMKDENTNNTTNNNNPEEKTKAIKRKLEEITSATIPINKINKNKSITSLVWHPQSKYLITGSYNGTINIYNPSNNYSLVGSLNQHTAPISQLKFSKSAQYFASSSIDGSIILWDLDKLQISKQLLIHNSPVLDIDFNNNNENILASAGLDGNMFLYDISSTNTQPKKLENSHNADVNCIRFDSSGNYLASASDDSTVHVYQLNNNNNNTNSDNNNNNNTNYELIHTLTDHIKPVLTLRFSLDNDKYPNQPIQLATGSADSTVRLYDIPTGKLIHTFNKHIHPITNILFQPGNALLLSASHDRIHIWSTNDGQLVKTFRSGGSAAVNNVNWDLLGRRIAVAYADGQAYLLDLQL